MSTIAAISTAQGQGGIGVIRISGEDSFKIADKVFKSASGKTICQIEGYRALYGHICHKGEIIDEAIALKFIAPKSFTGENVVELSCHGGAVVSGEVLSAVIEAGADLAQAGEFTKRAFLNGKIDLTEAESVMDIISAKSKSAARAAMYVREGAIFKKTREVKEELLTAAAHLSAWADYPDEDIPSVDGKTVEKTIDNSIEALDRLLSTYDMGQAVKEGIDTVIAGRPNAGKSTLMNILAGREKSIVTSIAGTTRDVVEDTVIVGNATLRLSDTAGIRSARDEIEKIGVEKTMERLKTAGLIIALFDSSQALTSQDIQFIDIIRDAPCIAVINKTDLDNKIDAEYIEKNFENTVYISAKNQENIDKLKSVIEKVAGTDKFDPGSGIIANERQRDAVKKALESLAEAKEAICAGMTLDAVTVSVGEAIEYLLELTGERAGEEIVDRVFHNFCVGK